MIDPASSTVLVTGGSGFIGTNLVAKLKSEGVAVVNIDTSAPLDDAQRDSWIHADVEDVSALQQVFADHHPTHVVHLAARVDIRGQTVGDYPTNTLGTANVLEAAHAHESIERLIVTSTQFVRRPGSSSPADEYDPHTAYGESKVEAEELTRQTDLPWTIVRPTTIWGPHDLLYRKTLYKTLDRGLYLHPGNITCHRSMGFVGNVVQQMLELLGADRSLVVGKTFYVGDPVVNLIEFVDAFALEITGRPARTVPAGVVKTLAVGGSALRAIGLPAPITLSRYRSMVEDYVVPLEPTYDVTGDPPYSLEDGVATTVSWLRGAGVIN